MSKCLLGIDIGTLGLKAAIVDPDVGQILESVLVEYAPQYPRPGWAEQNPETWMEAMVTAVQKVFSRSEIDPGAIVQLDWQSRLCRPHLANPTMAAATRTSDLEPGGYHAATQRLFALSLHR